MEDNSYYPAHNIFETIMAVRKCVKCGGCMGCPYYNKGNLQCTEKNGNYFLKDILYYLNRK